MRGETKKYIWYYSEGFFCYARIGNAYGSWVEFPCDKSEVEKEVEKLKMIEKVI